MTTTVLVDMHHAETRPAVDEFLPRNAKLTIAHIPHTSDNVDIVLHFRSAHQDLYQYLPFNIHVAPENGIGDIVEVSRPETLTRVEIHNVPLRRGTVDLTFQGECGSVPAHRGLGPDIRELSMLLTTVEVRSPQSSQVSMRAMNTLTPPWRTGLDDDALPPIFVIGPYRSGTSITTWAVGQHPNIAPLEETGWVHTSLMALRATYRLANSRANPASAEYDLPEQEFAAHMASSLNDLHLRIARRRAKRDLRQRVVGMAPRFTFDLQLERSLWSPKRRWIDGTPEQSLAARQLAEAFDASKFLVMLRDPLLVMRSLAFFDRAGGATMSDEAAAQHWLQYTAAGCDLFHLLGPDRVMFVDFAALATDTKQNLRTIYSFLGESNFSHAANAFRRKINSSKAEGQEYAPPEDLLSRPRALYKRLLARDIPSVEDFHLGPLGDFANRQEGSIDAVRQAFS